MRAHTHTARQLRLLRRRLPRECRGSLGSRFDTSKVAVVDLSAANTGPKRPMDLIVGWPILSQGAFYIDHAAQTASHRF